MIRIEPRRRRTPEISIAPLVDCVLLLLVFFLLTSSFSERLGIKISLPGSVAAREMEQGTLDIMVADTGEITFRGIAVEAGDLTSVLQSVIDKEGDMPALLLADGGVSIETATMIIDSVRAAGIERLAIATRRKEEGS